MINKRYEAMLSEKDVIFEIFDYATQQIAKVGEDKVYNFSLGNPSVPAPATVNEAIIRNVREVDPLKLHSYSPGKGLPLAREAMAAGLNKRYGSHYCGDNIFMTVSASGALAHAFRAVAEPGDEILTFAPCFSEYVPYTAGAGLKLKVVPADTETFQINFEAAEAMLTPEVSAVLVNSPNNPSGIVYSTETIQRLAALLRDKAAAFGHPIYLISDEPYRDIVFTGVDSPYIANFYENTLTCYSFSKSLSIPGERIGYLAVNPECEGAATIIDICPQISRTLGFNGAAGLMQRVVAETCLDTADLSVYEKNMRLLYDTLTDCGFTCVRPGGTFYMFPKSLEPDDFAFCEKAKTLNLMLVPGSIFGCPGHFRIAYCVPTEKVEAALPVFRQLAALYK